MTCPTCGGTKVLRGLGKPIHGPCHWMEIPCYRCHGTGEVESVQAIWIEEGKYLREFREKRDWSVREAANWLHVLPSEWSKAEHGTVDPSSVHGALQQRVLKDLAGQTRDE